MELEFASLIAATASLFITIPLAALARTQHVTHALLIRVAFSTGYSLLAISFVVGAFVHQSPSETLHFTHGLGAGIAVGLLLSGCVLYMYDAANRVRSRQSSRSKP